MYSHVHLGCVSFFFGGGGGVILFCWGGGGVGWLDGQAMRIGMTPSKAIPYGFLQGNSRFSGNENWDDTRKTGTRVGFLSRLPKTDSFPKPGLGQSLLSTSKCWEPRIGSQVVG